MVLPRDHVPVCALMVVLFFADPALPGTAVSDVFLSALGVVAVGLSATADVVVDILELFREWPGLEEALRESRDDSAFLGGGAV